MVNQMIIFHRKPVWKACLDPRSSYRVMPRAALWIDLIAVQEIFDAKTQAEA